jgi:undecaprenyl-diphosphatase
MLFRNSVKNFLFLLVYILSGLALVIIIDGLVTGSELTPFNTAIAEAVAHLRTPILTAFMISITNLGSPFMLSIFALFVAIFIVLHRDTFDTLLFLVSTFFANLSFVLLKNLLHLPRPTGGLVTLTSWSFPSGHATVATAFFFAVAYSFFDHYKTFKGRTILVASCIVAAGLVCFSRVYLGVHFALDVLAGIALGLLSVSFTILIFNIFVQEKSFIRRRRNV